MVQLSGPSVPPRAGGAPRQLVVLLHGVGADGRDLIELAPLLARHLPDAAFHAPDAPSPATWPPTAGNGSACRTAGRRRCWRACAGRTPPGRIPHLVAGTSRPRRRALALLGFSQGTMMALYTALRRPRPLAGVLGFSGALLGPRAWCGRSAHAPLSC